MAFSVDHTLNSFLLIARPKILIMSEIESSWIHYSIRARFTSECEDGASEVPNETVAMYEVNVALLEILDGQ